MSDHKKRLRVWFPRTRKPKLKTRRSREYKFEWIWISFVFFLWSFLQQSEQKSNLLDNLIQYFEPLSISKEFCMIFWPETSDSLASVGTLTRKDPGFKNGRIKENPALRRDFLPSFPTIYFT
ncbi:hypothetical protein EHO62_03755 [Leptospira kmetyi]|nr:hypothetical protein EHO62_03755 [Leptospira kmetyi]TGK28464.1 hypothetical protein EHO66_13235 [Leptospira kmetyi]